MKNNIKQKLSNDKGITLVALVITIAIMLIIVGVSINTGTESMDTTRLQGFYMQLETVQKRADDIVTTNEGYYKKNNDGTKTYIDLKTVGGSSVTGEQINFLQGLGITIPASEFRYFTVSDLEEQLDLIEMDYNVFIHFNTRTVIAENGININGEMYYMLQNNIYFPEYDSNKNKGEIASLNYNIIVYETNKYKIVVEPSNSIGDLNKTGTLRYKKTTTKYWETSTNLEMIITEATRYNVEYKDNNNNTVSEIIEISLDQSGNPIITLVTE